MIDLLTNGVQMMVTVYASVDLKSYVGMYITTQPTTHSYQLLQKQIGVFQVYLPFIQPSYN